nr:MAG TPA: hypothetical protein [Caudoviricetes sp.]
MSFSLYAHRLTDLLVSAFTFTFSPSQAFSSFYLIYIFSARAEEIYVYWFSSTVIVNIFLSFPSSSLIQRTRNP